MNQKTYRLVFSRLRGMLVAVEETATSAGRAGETRAAGRASGALEICLSLRQLTLSALLALAPVMASGQIVPGGAHAPGVVTTQNGIPQVNINKPGGLKMRVGMKTVSASGTVTIALLVAVSLFRDSTFFATRTPLSRLLVSGGTGILVALCAVAVAALFASGYFFLKMVNSPQQGKTVFDARMLKGRSLFSDAYLSDEGKEARSKLYKALIYFCGSWTGAVFIGIAMQITYSGTS
jgi:hypothetical protein